ncbi:beta-lactamase family protein [Dyadobacter sp. CY326]|uniref:beta-lactamase family protein n=1 Tax=Dyadobacter sp. CY326 TaxID=2907300 RepID=UPI001F1CD430|nr:beta-lactamase family protein [Dyadobacter sp. CY326]MCE7065007.1 beta-lactamase family protein [Dyadobacter sp. CY326]
MRLSNLLQASILLQFFTIQVVFGQDTKVNLSALFDTLHARRNFDGCVLIARKGEVMFEKAYGLADEASARPINTKTLFELASVSKQFTAMAVMQLKAKGLLAYSDSIQKFLPGLPYKGVTIRDLLVHTAGIPDFLGWDEADLDVSRVNTNEDILKELPAKYPSVAFPAGTRYAYSNTNYLLLACIVEKLSGIPIAEYLDRNVFQPAGMLDTKAYSRRSASTKLANYANSYFWDPAAQCYVHMDSVASYALHMDGIVGPYGISSNVGDLFRWDQALYTEKLLSRAELREAFQPSLLKNGRDLVKTPSGMISGFGWEIIPDPDSGSLEMFHSGGYGGYANLIVRNTGKKETVILLSNHKAMVDVYAIMTAIDDILNNAPVAIPDRVINPKSVPTKAAQLATFAGNYAPTVAPGFKFRIRIKGNRLYAKAQDGIESPIYAASADTFFFADADAKIRFSKDNNGKVEKLILIQDGQETPMLRIDPVPAIPHNLPSH